MTNQVSDTDEVYYDDRLKFPIILPEHFRLRVEGIPQIPAFPPIPAFPNEIKVEIQGIPAFPGHFVHVNEIDSKF